MRNYLQQLTWKLARWMQGRNGQDDLARCIFWAGLAVWAVGFVLMSPMLNTVSTLLWAYALFRMLSRNIAKRRAENAVFLQKTEGLRRQFRQRKLRFDERKEYCFFRCKCGTVLRCRRGQGKKELICPRCQAHMTRNTH